MDDSKYCVGAENMNYRILLTDDEPILRKVGTAMLKQLGHTVIEASDGLEALEILESESTIDLLMTDLFMPGGMSGEQLASEAIELRPNLKIIYLSGDTDNLEILESATAMNIHFLGKPFGLDQLREALSLRFKAV